jgi:hypothetical protein
MLTKDRQNNKCRNGCGWPESQRGRESFLGIDEPSGRSSPRKRLPTPSTDGTQRRIAVSLCLLLLLATQAAAHPISVTQSFVYVTRDKVTVHIDVFVEDLFLFHNLKPNDQDFLEPDVIEDGIGKHEQFLLDRFAIRNVGGERLVGRSVEVKRFDMQAEGVPMAELMAHKLTFVQEYVLDAPPEFLTFSQHFVDDKLLVPAEMQLNVKQENAGTPHRQVLYPDSPQTVRFSWDNPPLSSDASEGEWQDWYERQKEETLGITSYSSVYSFLYITDYEVRHEILIPLLTLDESVLIARDDGNFLEIAEQDLAAEQIRAFFKAGNPVEIDGVLVEPVIDRLDFYGLDFKDFARRAERSRVSMASARVGIILSYSTKGTPDTVRVTWDRFNRFLWSVNMIVYAFEDTQTAALTRIGRQNTFEWQNPGRPPTPPLEQVDVVLPPRPMWSLPLVSLGLVLLVPVALMHRPRNDSTSSRSRETSDRNQDTSDRTQDTSDRTQDTPDARPLGDGRRSRFRGPLVLLLIGGAVAAWPYARWQLPSPLAGTPQLPDEQAAATLAALHKNLYRAFDYRDEHQVYDALAKSVDGPLLRDLYLEIRRGLVMQEQGGAVSRIREVRIVDNRPVPPDRTTGATDERAFAYLCRWTVTGTVEHWGHIHARTNEYQAHLTVEPRDNAWKITSLDLQDERRVSFETSLRGM